MNIYYLTCNIKHSFPFPPVKERELYNTNRPFHVCTVLVSSYSQLKELFYLIPIINISCSQTNRTSQLFCRTLKSCTISIK